MSVAALGLDEVRRSNRAMHQPEFAYSVKIETANGKTADVPIAFMTREQLESFLQFDFKQLVERAGMKGARVHVERANTVDYDKVLGEIAACLSRKC